MLTKTVPEKQRAPDQQARTAGGPDPESDSTSARRTAIGSD